MFNRGQPAYHLAQTGLSPRKMQTQSITDILQKGYSEAMRCFQRYVPGFSVVAPPGRCNCMGLEILPGYLRLTWFSGECKLVSAWTLHSQPEYQEPWGSLKKFL